ncbi:hypothetical protein Tco_0652844 [Tanacetum coccineum]|uniref:Uncharacterized protein n=1 Tax=Tanacetum coccineum TaxID=301880 RepID=A0ABQ4WZI4_9ASTR
MLHGLGEFNPTHAYYNGSRTSKDNEDPGWNTSFKTRRTQKTTSAVEALWKTILHCYLYLLGTLSFNFINPRLFEIAFRIFFREVHQTFREKMYHNLNQLQWQLERDSCHRYNSKTCLGHDSKTCLGALRTQFKEFFDSKEYLEELDKLIDERVLKYDALRMKKKEFQAINKIERRLQESKMQKQENLVSKCTPLEDCLVTNIAELKACLITEGAVIEACLVTEESCGTESENSSFVTLLSKSKDEIRSSDKDSSSSMNECIKSGNDNRSSDHESTSLGNDADADIGSLYDSDKVTEVPHSSNDTFENVFAYEIQRHEQPESIPDTYEIKLLNDEISYLKSQDYEKDKTFAKENKKFNEYVQPLLNRKNELEKKNQEFLKQINDLDNRLQKAGQTDRTLRMLLPKEDNVNTGKQGLGKYELSDHKIISEEELKCEAEKRLKVKQRKSPLSYHGFVYAETQFEEQPKVPLKIRNVNLKEHLE